MARLGDVCVINPKAPPIEDTLLVSFVPMPKVGEEGEFDPSETRPYAEVKKGFTYFAEGDVLFAKITPCMENGKGAVAHNLENRIGYGSTEFHVLRPKSGLILGEWLYYLTAWPSFRKEAERNMTGSAGQKRVPKDFLENYRLTVPSIHDQQQHVQTLNKLCALISLRKQQIAKLDELVKARFIEMFGDLAAPSCTWPTTMLSEACGDPDDIKCGPFGTQLSKDEYVENGVALWEIPQINSRFATAPTHFLTVEKACQLASYSIIPGDIAMSRKGNVGKCAVFPNEYADGIIHSDVLRIRVDNNKMDSVFLMHQLHISGAVQHQIELVSSGAIMAGINVTKLKNIDVHIPPLDLQHQFAAFVAQTDQQKLTIQHSLAKLELLKKALMQKYFG